MTASDKEFIYKELGRIRERITVLQGICLETPGLRHVHLPLTFIGALIDKMSAFTKNPNVLRDPSFKDMPGPDPVILSGDLDESVSVEDSPEPVRANEPVRSAGDGWLAGRREETSPLEPVDESLLELEEGENKVGWHRPMPRKLQNAVVKEYESGEHRTLVSIATKFRAYKIGVWRIRNLLISRGIYEARRTDRIGPEKKHAAKILSLCNWNTLKISRALSVSQPTVTGYLEDLNEIPLTVVPFKGRQVK